MSLAPAHTLPRAAIDAKLLSILSASAIGLGVLLSGFVIREPAPYELYMVGLIAVWALFGLRISRPVALLLTLFVLFNLGGLLSMLQMDDLYETPLYLAVSFFLALTSVFFAAVTSARPDLYRLIFNTWTVAAVVTSILGIAGYFNLFPGAHVFTMYDRAAGAFQDPNVFGPYLALPGMWLLYLFLTGSPSRMLACLVPLLIVTAGVFLSFSRGAWGLFGFTTLLLTLFLVVQNPSGKFRLRVILLSLAALVLLMLAMIVLLQIPGVADMLSQRAKLVQDYDGARLGRFARYTIGLDWALTHPFGIGPLNFGRLLGEDTHNIWLKTLMDYGWLGFLSFLAIVVTTLAGGFRILFRDRPWQPFLLVAYVVYIGHLALGLVIDTDHWRHYYLLIGLIWGAIALEYRHERLASPALGAGRVAPGLQARSMARSPS